MFYSVIASDTFTRVDLENEGAAVFFWGLVIILVIVFIIRLISDKK